MIGIDPGPKESAYVRMTDDGKYIRASGKIGNDAMVLLLEEWAEADSGPIVCEMIASYGMTVGAEVFDTCVWIGRFQQAYDFAPGWHTITRVEVKKRLCHKTAGVNDAVIRQRLIDIYGGKVSALGNKANPGPLYGVKGDIWAALAVAVAWRMGAT